MAARGAGAAAKGENSARGLQVPPKPR